MKEVMEAIRQSCHQLYRRATIFQSRLPFPNNPFLLAVLFEIPRFPILEAWPVTVSWFRQLLVLFWIALLPFSSAPFLVFASNLFDHRLLNNPEIKLHNF